MRVLNRSQAGVPAPPPEKILQFGGGNFLRAFADWMVDLMNERLDYGAGILVVKPTPGGNYRALEEQEGLYHLYLRGRQEGAVTEQCRLISCVSRSIHPYEDYGAFLRSAEQAGIKLIISNTTEAGIAFRESDRLTDQPARSFPGKLTQWLYHRYRYFGGHSEAGCTILPTELVDANGTTLRHFVQRYARRWELETGFHEWLEAHHDFCNTLVDRIVPGFPEDAAAIQQQLGFHDRLLVTGEPYHLWAIEGSARARRRFPADQAGLNVRYVDDLHAIRTLKVRLLNGAHTAMVPLGLLMGIESVGEGIADATLGPFIEDLLHQEIIPTLPHPAAETEAYAHDVLERFGNPFIHHRLADIALNSSAKFASRLQPSLEAAFRQSGTLPHRLTLALAALIRLYRGNVIDRRDETAALRHFDQAWEAASPAEVSRRALTWWTFSPALRQALEPAVGDLLEEMESVPVSNLLQHINNDLN